MISRIIITGNIAVGKSLVVSLFKKKGVFVIDTDNLVRGLLKKERIKQQLFHYFGNDIFNVKDVDRFVLAEKVFSSRNVLCFLEDLLHPVVRMMVELATRQLIKSGYSKKYYLIVIPVYINNRYPIDGNQILLVDSQKDIKAYKVDMSDLNNTPNTNSNYILEVDELKKYLDIVGKSNIDIDIDTLLFGRGRSK